LAPLSYLAKNSFNGTAHFADCHQIERAAQKGIKIFNATEVSLTTKIYVWLVKM